MSTQLPNLSLHQLTQLIATNPLCKNLIYRQLLESYDDFIKVLYDDLDSAINRLESNPQLHQSKTEDELSEYIVSMLAMRGYDASNGTTNGGNKDITVKGADPSWSWIGEAKIYKSVTDMREGFLQLATRYRNLNPSNSCGGLLAYIFRQYASDLMDQWKHEIPNLKFRNLSFAPCIRRDRLAFFSTHDHESSGLAFEVRHVGVCLYFQPQDKSGRTAQKYKSSQK